MKVFEEVFRTYSFPKAAVLCFLILYYTFKNCIEANSTLREAFKSLRSRSKRYSLAQLFVWQETYQGHAFWNNIYEEIDRGIK